MLMTAHLLSATASPAGEQSRDRYAKSFPLAPTTVAVRLPEDRMRNLINVAIGEPADGRRFRAKGTSTAVARPQKAS
jgi:hypothetical protein